MEFMMYLSIFLISYRQDSLERYLDFRSVCDMSKTGTTGGGRGGELIPTKWCIAPPVSTPSPISDNSFVRYFKKGGMIKLQPCLVPYIEGVILDAI